MTARVITGSKEQIIDHVVAIEGDIREAIIFVNEQGETSLPSADVAETFAEMEAFTVRQAQVDDSRDTLYQPLEGE